MLASNESSAPLLFTLSNRALLQTAKGSAGMANSDDAVSEDLAQGTRAEGKTFRESIPGKAIRVPQLWLRIFDP